MKTLESSWKAREGSWRFLALESSEEIRNALQKSGDVWKGLESSGELWRAFEKYGELWRALESSTSMVFL